METLPLVHPEESIMNQFEWNPRYVKAIRPSAENRRPQSEDNYGLKTVAEWATDVLNHVTEYAQQHTLSMDTVDRLFKLDFFDPPPVSDIPEDLITVVLPASDYLSVPLTNTHPVELAREIDSIVSDLDSKQTNNGTALYNSVFKMLRNLNPRAFGDHRKQTAIMHYVFTEPELIGVLAIRSGHTDTANSGRVKPRHPQADLDLYPAQRLESSPNPFSGGTSLPGASVSTEAPNPLSPSSPQPRGETHPAKKTKRNAPPLKYPKPAESIITSVLITALSEDVADVTAHSQVMSRAALIKHMRVSDIFPALHEWLSPLTFVERALFVFTLKGATKCLSCSQPVTILPDRVPMHNCLSTRFLSTFSDTAWTRSGLRTYHHAPRLWTRLTSKSPATKLFGLTRLHDHEAKRFDASRLLDFSLPVTWTDNLPSSQRIERASDSSSDSDVDVTGCVITADNP